MWTLNSQNQTCHAFLCVSQFLLPKTFCLIELQITLMKESQTTIREKNNYPTPPTTIPPNSWFNQRKMANLVQDMTKKKFRVKGLMLKACLPNNSIKNSFSLLIVKNLCIHKFSLLLFFKSYSKSKQGNYTDNYNNNRKPIYLFRIYFSHKHILEISKFYAPSTWILFSCDHLPW
jgi:hypothetical protein